MNTLRTSFNLVSPTLLFWALIYAFDTTARSLIFATVHPLDKPGSVQLINIIDKQS